MLREGHDRQRAGAEEHQRESIVGPLRDELGQQLARGLALDGTVVPGLLRADDRIDLPPVGRQHAQIHAAAAVDEHQDLGAVSGTNHLRLGNTRSCQR